MRVQTEPSGAPHPSGSLFTVESVDDTARQAERAGRSLQQTTAADLARLALIEDPQGAAFAAFEGETDP